MPDNQVTMRTPLCLIHLLLILALGNAVSPSGITSRTPRYAERTLAQEEICHPSGTAKESLRLPKTDNSGLIISPAYVFDHWGYRPADFRCKFIIKAPKKGDHLFAVIQNISFRRNESGGCIDYVKFRRKDKNSTDKFCGNFDRKKLRHSLEYSEDYNQLISNNSSFTHGEFDPQGEIETTIFVSKESLKDNEHLLNLTIVYTPYKDCEKVDYGQYRTTRYGVCIWREYFCDGYTNCFAGICVDEELCPDEIMSTTTGTKVTIGAVTTIFLCFVILLMGLWICRRHKKLCWSTDCAGPSSREVRVADRDSGGSGHPSVGISPMGIAVLPSPLDKDLPPSYDSLFPEEARAT